MKKLYNLAAIEWNGILFSPFIVSYGPYSPVDIIVEYILAGIT